MLAFKRAFYYAIMSAPQGKFPKVCDSVCEWIKVCKKSKFQSVKG